MKNMNAKEYVEWFHSKFVDRLGKQWPNMFKDQEALIWIIEKYDVKSVFEIGTWEGNTALCMWLHPNVKVLKTIDIRQEYGHPYHKPKNTYGIYLEYTKALQETISSVDYVPKENEQWDMVFVEGNHAYDFVKNDFHLALKFKPKVIAFHDYKNGNGGVDKFLDELWAQEQHKDKLKLYPGSAVVYYEVKGS